MSDGKSRFRISSLISAMMLMVLLVSAVPSALAYSPSWDSLKPLFEGKSQAVVVADNDNNTVYMFGGLTGLSGSACSSFAYDVNTGFTTRITSMPVGVRGASGGLGEDGRVYIFSGWNTTNVATTQVYDIATDSWSTETAIPNNVFKGDCAVVWPEFYIFGGTGAATMVQIYSASNDSWYMGSPIPWGEARKAGAAAYSETENAIYFIGGVNGGDVTTDTVYRFDIDSDSWSNRTALPNQLAAFDATVGVDGIIYAVGGSDVDAHFALQVYSAGYYYCSNNDSWHSLPDMSNARKYLSVVSLADGRILAIGGNDNLGIFDYVESLKVVSTTTSLSLSSIGQGRSTMLNLSFNSYASQTAADVMFYLKADSGQVYPAQALQFLSPGAPSVIVEIAQSMPAGQYELHAFWALFFETGEYNLPEVTIHFDIFATVPLQDQISDLQSQINKLNATFTDRLNTQTGQISDLKHLNDEQQNDIDDLLSQLNQTNSDLNDAINQLNNKADSAQNAADSAGTYAIIALGLGVILIIVLIINILMARKR